MPLQKIVKEFDARLQPSILAAKSICLTTHVNPDGDGLCACLALKRILAGLGIESTIVVDDLDLNRYEFLQVKENVKVDSPELQFDLVIVIDFHDYERLANRVHLLKSAHHVIVIDHHEINDDMVECDFCWVDASAVCTGWMVYSLFKETINGLAQEDKLYVGKCLYTTVLNDTNNFTNSNTDSHAFELSAAICQYGVKPYEIQKTFMVSRSSGEMRLLGQVLATIELHDKGRILFMDCTLAMLEENQLSGEATSNFTRYIQDLKGVETVVFFREVSLHHYKLSLRSKLVNVHSIAVKYGGGGHIQASGCNMTGSLHDLKDKLLTEIHLAERLVH